MTTPQTILIADDETHILNVLSVKLQNAGFDVIRAEDGAEAFDLACAHRPDLIITDYQMPHLSGIELCTRLQANPETAEIPALLLTARGFAISRDEKITGNVRDVIDKPFSPREVLAHVLTALTPEAAGMT